MTTWIAFQLALNMCCQWMLHVYCSRELEAKQNLDADSELDFFALHHVFMPLLRRELEQLVIHEIITSCILNKIGPHCSYSSLD